MTPLLAAILLLCLQITNSFAISENLATVNDLDGLSTSGVSNQCLSDISIFMESLRTIYTTLDQCRINRGCTDEQKLILMENMFALKQFDSFGKVPPGLMELTIISSGSYRECTQIEAPYNTHYCYARAIMENQTDNPVADLGVKVAVCMPTSCSEKDIPKVLGSFDFGGLAALHFVDADCVPTKVVPTTAFWIFMSFMAFFVVWAIAATAFDYVLHAYFNGKVIKNKVVDAFLAFSFYTNAATILDMSPPKEGNIKSLASIRFISMTWVASGHTLLENTFGDTVLPIFSMWNPFLSVTILNAFLSVDTFFLLSGILVSYLFFKAKPLLRYVKNPMTWIMFYVHRYLRLTPPMMLFIGFYVVILPFTDGPYSAALTDYLGTIEDNVRRCQDNWWRNMLYINNFYLEEGAAACYNILWYLALDTQFYFVAPIFLVSLYLFPVVGFILLTLCCAGSIAYVYVATYRYDLPATIIGFFSSFSGKIDVFFSEYYEKPWARCTPYFIGIIVGYILVKFRDRRPKLNKIIIVVIWIAATAVGFACVYSPYRYIKGDHNWSKFTRATYNNFSRIGWSIAVSWVIVANHLGWGGPIATFMEHPLWQPLGRLSYCAYIVHSFVIHYVFNLDDRPAHYVSIWQTYVYRVIPVVVLSYFFAFVWSCLFEVSSIKLEKLLIGGIVPNRKPRSIKPEPNGEAVPAKEENGDLKL
ncbi:hypothetical protein Y032_0187g1123 [Ancylostoma ceylanicum]|uniref:Nose resistant-to-fluoxetine protein N-terminal domain-containing protein n=1 Tax=Ancylostoma ceylanicum TaxID=53326 RepID=A0A016SR70_9BILA|nr:hypothetical protein Y032_0187g1123 [Ancylostoma ceylanicum]